MGSFTWNPHQRALVAAVNSYALDLDAKKDLLQFSQEEIQQTFFALLGFSEMKQRMVKESTFSFQHTGSVAAKWIPRFYEKYSKLAFHAIDEDDLLFDMYYVSMFIKNSTPEGVGGPSEYLTGEKFHEILSTYVDGLESGTLLALQKKRDALKKDKSFKTLDDKEKEQAEFTDKMTSLLIAKENRGLLEYILTHERDRVKSVTLSFYDNGLAESIQRKCRWTWRRFERTRTLVDILINGNITRCKVCECFVLKSREQTRFCSTRHRNLYNKRKSRE
jgi:hypothetical protein